MQVVSVDCDTTSYDLQPTFSECLEYFEGDPCEDTRQSKKQKVCLRPAWSEDVGVMSHVMLLRSLLWHICWYQSFAHSCCRDTLQQMCPQAVAL